MIDLANQGLNQDMWTVTGFYWWWSTNYWTEGGLCYEGNCRGYSR